MDNLLLSLLFGLSRALHGGGYVSRIVSVLIMAAGYGGCLLLEGFDWQAAGIGALIAGAGLYLGLLLGWGKGFAAITGRYNPAEKDFWPADKVGDYVWERTGDGYKAGVALLTVRSILFIPMFIALGWYFGGMIAYLLSGLAVFSMGLVYWWSGKIAPEKYAVRLAEFSYFAIIGGAIA